MLRRTVDIDLVAEIVLEPVGIVVAAVVAVVGAALAAVVHIAAVPFVRIAAVPFVRIDCRPVGLDIVGRRLKRRGNNGIIIFVSCVVLFDGLVAYEIDTYRSCPLTLNLNRVEEMNLANSMSPLCDWRLRH